MHSSTHELIYPSTHPFMQPSIHATIHPCNHSSMQPPIHATTHPCTSDAHKTTWKFSANQATPFKTWLISFLTVRRVVDFLKNFKLMKNKIILVIQNFSLMSKNIFFVRCHCENNFWHFIVFTILERKLFHLFLNKTLWRRS